VSPFFESIFYKIIYTEGNYIQKIFGTLFGYVKRIIQIFQIPFYDGIYIFLYVTPFGSSLFERIYCTLSKKIIYDIDDLTFMGKTSKNNSFISILRKPDKYFYLMKVADHVITCTPFLDSIVKKYNSKTTDISSTINTDKYLPIENYSNDHRLIIGWSGSHSTVPYLQLLVPVLQNLKDKQDFKLLVIGTSNFEIEGVDVEAIPWSEANEVRELSRIDVGIYPLPDEEWVLGKSGLKALQYMALGIPTVATAIGTNFRIIEDGVSGFLVNTEEEWIRRLSSLLNSGELRKKIGIKGKARVDKFYSIHANKKIYLQIFNEVYNN
jgi:glycosyltransferase involved in cell wall biosynthesis